MSQCENASMDYNFAVLLPKSAQVTVIYCAAAAAPAVPAECTNAYCPESIRAQADDSLYTKGRGVIFNVRNLTAEPDHRTNVGFWVTWR
jgi:hypothetical protein